MIYPHIAQLGRWAAMEKVGQRAVAKALAGVKPPKPPRVPVSHVKRMRARSAAAAAEAAEAVPSGKSFKAPTKADLHMSMQGIGGNLESLGSGAVKAQQKQYADLLAAMQKRQPGFVGPILMPGMPGFKYPANSSLPPAMRPPSRRVGPQRSPGQETKIREITTDAGNR